MGIGISCALALSACSASPGPTPLPPSGGLATAVPPAVAGTEASGPVTEAPVAGTAAAPVAGTAEAPAAALAIGVPSAVTTVEPTPAVSNGANSLTALGPGLEFGAQIDEKEITQSAVCQAAQNLGVKAATLWFPWRAWEPQPGRYNTAQLDQVVQQFAACGITDLGMHFQSLSSWATQAPEQQGNGASTGASQGARASTPPKNQDDLYNGIVQLATHYKGKFKRYALENEASAPGAWGAPVETYFQTLATFDRAVKAADPSATVEDSGTGSEGFGVIIAQQMMQQGKTQEAQEFLNDYYAHFAIGRKAFKLNSPTDVQSFFNQALLQNAVQITSQWMPMLYSQNAQYDANQVHYYQPWWLLPTVLNYVKSQMQAGGKERPIDMWELGYGWQDQSSYNATAHAEDTVKLLVVAAGEGVGRMIYWPLLGKPERGTPGLIDSNGQPTPAGVAYKTTVQLLSGSTASQAIALGNPAVWCYKLTNQGKDIYVVWGTSNATVSLPITAAKVSITDINGKATSGDPKSIAVTTSPVFVQAAQ